MEIRIDFPGGSRVDAHFGWAKHLAVYDIDAQGYSFVQDFAFGDDLAEDGNEDNSWDGVWEGRTRRDDTVDVQGLACGHACCLRRRCVDFLGRRCCCCAWPSSSWPSSWPPSRAAR